MSGRELKASVDEAVAPEMRAPTQTGEGARGKATEPDTGGKGPDGVTVLKCWDSEWLQSSEAQRRPANLCRTLETRAGHRTSIHLHSPLATPKYTYRCHTHFTDGDAEAP